MIKGLFIISLIYFPFELKVALCETFPPYHTYGYYCAFPRWRWTRPPTQGQGFTQDNNTYRAYLSLLSENHFHVLTCFFSQSSFLTLCSHSPFLSLCQKRPDFTRDHTGCDCEACFRRLPAVGGSGGLGDCHLCDYPVGTVGSFLHPQDAAQPSTHIHLPVWIGKDAPEFVSDFLN